MKSGTLGELVLARSVIKHIRKHNKSIDRGAGVGVDASSFKLKNEDGRILMTESVNELPDIAWVKSLNNLFAAGGRPVGVRITALLPKDVDEHEIKGYMAMFNSFADVSRVQIIGGHTEIGRGYTRPSFVVSALGVSGDRMPETKKVIPGDDIVMTKYAGILGNDIIVRNRADELKKVYSESYIEGSYFGSGMYGVDKEAGLIDDESLGIRYMHDVSRGGVYGALWQLGVGMGRGISVDNSLIPIRQETIEICECFNINPYLLEGTGSLLIVAANGTEVVNRLGDMGINASVVGSVTGNNERVVNTGSEKRFLSPICGDEIYKVISDEAE